MAAVRSSEHTAPSPSLRLPLAKPNDSPLRMGAYPCTTRAGHSGRRPARGRSGPPLWPTAIRRLFFSCSPSFTTSCLVHICCHEYGSMIFPVYHS